MLLPGGGTTPSGLRHVKRHWHVRPADSAPLSVNVVGQFKRIMSNQQCQFCASASLLASPAAQAMCHLIVLYGGFNLHSHVACCTCNFRKPQIVCDTWYLLLQVQVLQQQLATVEAASCTELELVQQQVEQAVAKEIAAR